MERHADRVLAAAAVLAGAMAIYALVAWGVFCYRNPLAGPMSYYTDFHSVVTWQKLDKYQVHEGAMRHDTARVLS